MNENSVVPAAEGAAKPAQNPEKFYEIQPKDPLSLLFTLLFCIFLADAFLWHGPSAALGVTVFLWYALLLRQLGSAPLLQRHNQVLLLTNLFLALTFALGSSWTFRLWNLLVLLVLLPVHAWSLSGAGLLNWWQPVMLWERFCLTLWGLFGNLGAPFAVLLSGKKQTLRKALPLVLGLGISAVLVAVLLPVLISADALFAFATEGFRNFLRDHFSVGLRKVLAGLVLTPFVFGFLYSLRHPKPLNASARTPFRAEDVLFITVLLALDILYLLFLAVQSSGLFGGADYLAARGISYAEWARSGFFQMVGVTALNLTVLLVALSFSRQQGKGRNAVRILSSALVLESLVLLASAAWRMSLYVSAYGLSFKRFMTYWGMVMMALLFFTALLKIRRPDFSFCRTAFPLMLAGWLVINCIPVDYLVAKHQVDRYLSGKSTTVSVHYLAHSLSYDTLSQLDRLEDDTLLCTLEGRWWGQEETLGTLLERRRESSRVDCADWHTWSLSAWLASCE